MKSFDLRILVSVFIFLLVAFLGVVAVRPFKQKILWVERLAPQGAFSAERVKDGLAFAVTDNAVRLYVDNCAADKFAEKFFLHIYPQSSQGGGPNDFVNLDFYLSQEPSEKVSSKGNTFCVYEKQFKGLAAYEIVVGQFVLEEGRCCKILWSRTFSKNFGGNISHVSIQK